MPYYDVPVADYYDMSDNYQTTRPQGMKDWLLAFTLSGEGSFITPAGEKRCRAGDLSLLRSGIPHQYGTVKGGHWQFVWAHLRPERIEAGLLPVDEVSIVPIETVTMRKRIYRAFRRMISDVREEAEDRNELSLCAIREILLLAKSNSRTRLDPRVQETIHYLSEHMKVPIRIDDVAKSVGVSPSRLSHLFKESTGQTIIECLNDIRIRQASLLIASESRTPSEAAAAVGFHNYNHFIRQFRRRLGVAPSEFLKGRK